MIIRYVSGALIGALMLISCGRAPAHSSITVRLPQAHAPAMSVQRLIRSIDDCPVADTRCSGRIMNELWARGYCNIDAQGHIARCTKEQIEEDKQATRVLEELH